MRRHHAQRAPRAHLKLEERSHLVPLKLGVVDELVEDEDGARVEPRLEPPQHRVRRRVQIGVEVRKGHRLGEGLRLLHALVERRKQGAADGFRGLRTAANECRGRGR